MGLSDEISKLMPANFGKNKASKPLLHKTSKPAGIKLQQTSIGSLVSDGKQTKPQQPELPPESQSRVEESKGADALPSYFVPEEHCVQLKGHSKAVAALTWDASGARLLSGGYDGDVEFWDFGGMDRSFRPFRSVEPYEGHKVHDVQFTPSTGDRFLVVTSHPQAKLYDRDGVELQEYKQGDMYIRDMRRTKGHVSSINCCAWSPAARNTFLTGAADSTIRIWDAEHPIGHKQVLVLRTPKKGSRVACTAARYSMDGGSIFSAQDDGAISVWAANGPYLRPSLHFESAHMAGTDTSGIACSRDGHTIVTRGGDDTVKVWDIRRLTSPVSSRAGLVSIYNHNNVIFSPEDERVIIVGTNVDKRGPESGSIRVLDRDTLEDIRTIPAIATPPDGKPQGGISVIRVEWHPKLNQLAAACSDGVVRLWYDAERSVKGAKLCMEKKPKFRDVGGEEGVDQITGPILTPHALPLFRDNEPRSTKRQREKLRKDPVASHRPQLPITGHGKGGFIGTNETQHIMKNLVKDTTRDEDPREAILKFAKEAEENPYWIAPAYKERQPKPLFDETGLADEPELKRRK